jgi:hypothetical protein
MPGDHRGFIWQFLRLLNIYLISCDRVQENGLFLVPIGNGLVDDLLYFGAYAGIEEFVVLR